MTSAESGGGRPVPVKVVLRLQRVVGNREVIRFLTPKPVPPLEPVVPLRRQDGWIVRLSEGGLIGAAVGAGAAVSLGQPFAAVAALGLLGMVAGGGVAWLIWKKR